MSAVPLDAESSNLFSDRGSLDACGACNGVSCCGRGGVIKAPFLSSHDVKTISMKTGLRPESFSDEVSNPHTGNTVRFLKATTTNGCHFLNAGRCGIHEFRPVDCRLFPLDVKKLEGELRWVIYNYEHCSLSERDQKVLLGQISAAKAALGAEILDYATVPTPGMAEMRYSMLSSVSEKTLTAA